LKSLPIVHSYRDATSSNELRGSTQPARPFARIRRQEPRVSPNSTRELGPIDATIFESVVAAARITTQCREMERTQRAGWRTGDDAGGADDTERAVVCGDSTGTLGSALTRPLSTAVNGGEGVLSAIAATVRAADVSVSNGADAETDVGAGARSLWCGALF
jgi:hypothetical protein